MTTTVTRRACLAAVLAFGSAAYARLARTSQFAGWLIQERMGKITRQNPATLPDSGGSGYSQISIAESGRLGFISGQVAWRPSREPVSPALSAQAAVAVANARQALVAAGATAADLLHVHVYLVDLTAARLEQVMPHLRALFTGSKPSVTSIGVAALAARELQIEIEMTIRPPALGVTIISKN
jgi:enamine deaminase RidA (YjgF/YER057c/UK114 family)